MSDPPKWHKPYYRILNYVAGPIIMAVSIPDLLTRGIFYKVRIHAGEPPIEKLNGFFIALLIGGTVTVFGWYKNSRRGKSEN